MTGIPGTVGRSDWRLPRAPGRPRRMRGSWVSGDRATEKTRWTISPLALQAVAFAALAMLAACHWTALVEPAQTRRGLIAALIATAGGIGVGLTGRLPRLLGVFVRIAVVLAVAVLATTAIGIRFKLLMPAGWSTLGDRVSGGLSVVGSVTAWPYGGPNVWLRLTTLLAAPLTLVLASALAFWPRRDRAGSGARRTAALVLLVLLYGVAVAARPFGHQELRGVALLACLVAWLWLPRLRGRDAIAAIAVIAVTALAALLITPKLAATQPWIDYRAWTWTLHHQKTFSYDWRHSYGPLHWPRKDITMMLATTKEPEYWKAETLDEFDGFRWTTPPLAQRDPTVVDREVTQNPKWIHSATITIRALSSQLVLAPGTIVDVHGLPADPIYLSNGAYLLNGKLTNGDTYTVRSYTPDPTPKQMRAAAPADEFFSRYTTIGLPESHGYRTTMLRVPLRREPGTGDPGAADALRASNYARMFALAKHITAGATTDYDIVRRIGNYLDQHYSYSEHVPVHKYPLEAFLFTDHRGYCQQFSGAAALMLRMLGVPTRIATGFAPGTKNPDTNEYAVKDLDAHSWIEVWFEGLGWVPFDPTPALAPAASQAASFAVSEVAASAAHGNAADHVPKKRLDELLGVSARGAALTSGDGTQWGWIIAGVTCLLLAIAAGWATLTRLAPGRLAPAPVSGDPAVDHLVRMLTRLGLEVPPGTTLLQLERRVERLSGSEAALYTRQLRRRRYAGAQDPAPDRWDRRKLRLMLASAAGAGPLMRLWLAMPARLRPVRGGRARP